MKRAKEILDEVKCLKCEKEERCVVYLPCAHIAHCFFMLKEVAAVYHLW